MHAIDQTQPVAGMDDATITELLKQFNDLPLLILKPPRTGLLMMSVTDCFNTGFHLGEVLVTEASVSLNGIEGYGMVSGEAPRKALARAAVDALLRSRGYTEQRNAVAEYLQRERDRQQRADQTEAALTAATRVTFDLMPGA